MSNPTTVHEMRLVVTAPHYDDAVGKENLGAVEAALTKRGLKPVSTSSVKRNQLELGDAVTFDEGKTA